MEADCVLYSTGCPKCRVLEKKLEKAGINYVIETNEKEITNICELLGWNTLPILRNGIEVYDFNAAIKWVGERINAN